MEFKKIFRLIIYLFAIIGFFLVVGYFAVKFGFTNSKSIIDSQRESFLKNKDPFIWQKGDEWGILKEAILKDKDSIIKAGEASEVNPRLIVAQLVVEQLRLFYSERELFKKVFYPLKVLGNQNQFSWGVMGIKETTAVEIEKNLKDTSSVFYLGEGFENLLDFNTNNIGQERFLRITDENDRYYSYLYTGLYLKQIIVQWQKAGFDISNQPEILSTLFNIGFEHSNPNADPKIGGSVIEIEGETYSFGSLAGEFYNSDELVGYFPR